MTKVAVVFHSGYGHTQKVAEAVAKGAGSVAGTTVSLIPVAEAQEKWAELDAADAIIFGSPTYMGSMSGPMKTFVDSTSKAWLAQSWTNKIGAGFTNSGSRSGDKLNTLIQFAVLAAQLGMIWVGQELMPGHNSSASSEESLNRLGSSLGLMTQSNVDQGPDVAPPHQDLETAEHFGKRIATATAQWVAGKTSLRIRCKPAQKGDNIP